MVFNFKQIAMALITIAISNVLSAQGNLQFNRVVQESFVLSLPSSNNLQSVTTITVPEGKVLKIESGSIYTGTLSVVGQSLGTVSFYYKSPMSAALLVNNHCIFQNSMISGNEAESVLYHPDHIWLNAGTYTLSVQVAYSSQENTTYRIGYSGIEFNIVPE